ncbi:MAG: restriction endonuclease [Candidatus Nitrotoga sp.]|nr:restriction endonuclease [Candidatus Nitrotoga sp.]MDP1855487.1 restriction endonuclease [Candidatus Nitrotoga sp.]
MPVPGFQDLMLPFLQICGDGKERTVPEIGEIIARQLQLSEVDLQETMSSGQRKFYNRVAWVKSYFGKACLLDFPSRGKFTITQRGLDLLKLNLQSIRVKTLNQFSEFEKFHKKRNSVESDERNINTVIQDEIDQITPEEQLENAYQDLRSQLAVNLLETILKNPPDFFEQLVVDLLVAMGYGGSRKDAGQALGKTGDGGIDGIIKEDKLGLDIIYLQAKRYGVDNVVPSREVRDFTGSLEGHGAQKGVLITTSSFTKDGIEFTKRLQQKKIVLIDGEKLTQLMIDNNIGVSTSATYTIKKIDIDYFDID